MHNEIMNERMQDIYEINKTYKLNKYKNGIK